MTVRKALTLVFATTLGFAAMGGLIGYLLGRFLPNYYRSVFVQGRDPEFDPIALGVGQGLTQGLVSGVLVGVLLVGILAWYGVKTSGTRE